MAEEEEWTPDGPVTMTTEHAVLYRGGSMLVRPTDPDFDREYPVETWIEAQQRQTHKVYRRRIVVVEEWTLMETESERVKRLDEDPNSYLNRQADQAW